MTFQARLKTAMRGGNLTVADLARWFDVPYPTVRGWVQDGHEPAGGPLDRIDIEERTSRLELAIRKKKGFPLARLSGRQRRDALLGIRSRVMVT